MDQDTDDTRAIDDTVAPPPPPAATSAAPAPADADPPTGLRHRVLGLRAPPARARPSRVLGGLGGAALGAVADGADTDQRGPGGGQFVPGQPGQQGQLPGRGGQFQGGVTGGQQGGLPPGTVPQDDVVPDSGAGDSTGGTTT